VHRRAGGEGQTIFSQMANIGDIECGENGGKADEFHVYASVLIWSITDKAMAKKSMMFHHCDYNK
jgi:hypothetical protein